MIPPLCRKLFGARTANIAFMMMWLKKFGAITIKDFQVYFWKQISVPTVKSVVIPNNPQTYTSLP